MLLFAFVKLILIGLLQLYMPFIGNTFSKSICLQIKNEKLLIFNLMNTLIYIQPTRICSDNCSKIFFIGA